MSGGFLSRWSKKKIDARAEIAKSERSPAPAAEQVAAMPGAESSAARVTAPAAGTMAMPAPSSPATPDALPPVESLTPESDFRPFLKPEVDPQLKNQALKALFKDPHFNVMDGLDVYIDDYSKPDPLPESLLRQLNQSKMLKLFDDEEKEQTGTVPGAIPGPGLPSAPQEANAENLVQNDADETKSPILSPLNESEPHQEPK